MRGGIAGGTLVFGIAAIAAAITFGMALGQELWLLGLPLGGFLVGVAIRGVGR